MNVWNAQEFSPEQTVCWDRDIHPEDIDDIVAPRIFSFDGEPLDIFVLKVASGLYYRWMEDPIPHWSRRGEIFIDGTWIRL